ncbi:MAG: SurA N-terminal domain-containing protein [Myxococcota bacterium]
MALLETIRQQTDSTWAKLVFGAVILVFVFWGIGASGGPKTQAVAEVNGERITDTELRRRLRDVTRGANMNQDDIQELTPLIIDQLVMTKALLQEADRLGIEVSDEEIAREIRSIEAFQTESGKFSQNLYERNLKRMGMTNGKFVTQLRDSMTLQKLEAFAAGAIQVTDRELEQLYRLNATEMSVEYVSIPDNALLDFVTVEDAAVDAFIAASEDELKQIYERDYDRLYHTPPKATLSQIFLKKGIEGFEDAQARQKLEEIRTAASSGEAFADLARQFSEDLSASNGGDMGTLAQQQLPEAAREPIFSTAAGQFTDIIEIEQGFTFFRVAALTEEVTREFDTVKAEIARQELARQELTTFSARVGDELLAAWKAEGNAPIKVLQKYGLVLETTGSVRKTDPQIPGAAGSPQLLTALKDVSEAGLLDGVYPTEGGRILANVTSFTEADMTAFERDKEMLRYQVQTQKVQAYLEVWRQDIVDRSTVVKYQ